MDLIIKAISVSGALAMAWFIYEYWHGQATPGHNLEHLAGAIFYVAAPIAICGISLAIDGKWNAIFTVCGLTTGFGTGAIIGFNIAKNRHDDTFAWAINAGILAMLIVSAPLAMYFLP